MLTAQSPHLRADRLGAAQRFIVLGLGRSGVAASRLLLNLGKDVVGTDDAYDTLASQTTALQEWGGSVQPPSASLVAEADALVLSPGVPRTHALVQAAYQAGVPVWGELELATRLVDIPIICVTGTNGKSTVVSLVSHIFTVMGIPHLLAGNIGKALCGELETLTGRERYLVLEASSFQLETTDRFHPEIACVLNIAPDHLNRYTSMDDYAEAKWRIAREQTAGDVLLVEKALAECIPAWISARNLVFSHEVPVPTGIGIEGAEIVWTGNGKLERTTMPAWMRKRRSHQRSNGLAALCICRLAGVPLALGVDAWSTFQDLPHRLEVVRRLRGVTYINDSKATNVHATIAALDAIENPVVLIAGGSDKGEDYAPLLKTAREKLVGLVLIGQTAPAMEQALAGAAQTVRAESLGDAVRKAQGLAQLGDVVLLSPAAASFDMFANFEERGRCFREEVMRL